MSRLRRTTISVTPIRAIRWRLLCTLISSDFRRFTERGLRTTKVTDANVVLEDLAATDGGGADLRVRPDHVEPWLRTLTSVRLAVATRLGLGVPVAEVRPALLDDVRRQAALERQALLLL